MTIELTSVEPMAQPSDEVARLRALNDTHVLDRGNEYRFDRLTRLCTQLFKVPLAYIAFVDRVTPRVKSYAGVIATTSPRREDAFSLRPPSDKTGWSKRGGRELLNTPRGKGVGLATTLLGVLLSLFVASTSLAASPPTRTMSPSQLVAKQINTIRVRFGLAPGTYINAYQSLLRQALTNSADPKFVPLKPGMLAEYALWGEVPVTTTPVVTSPGDVPVTTTPVVTSPGDVPVTTTTVVTIPGAVVTGWVFQDGWRGTLALTWNLDCVSANAPGCNSHRRAVLSRPPAPHARLFIASLAQRVDVGGSLMWRVATLLIWRVGH